MRPADSSSDWLLQLTAARSLAAVGEPAALMLKASGRFHRTWWQSLAGIWLDENATVIYNSGSSAAKWIYIAWRPTAANNFIVVFAGNNMLFCIRLKASLHLIRPKCSYCNITVMDLSSGATFVLRKPNQRVTVGPWSFPRQSPGGSGPDSCCKSCRRFIFLDFVSTVGSATSCISLKLAGLWPFVSSPSFCHGSPAPTAATILFFCLSRH